MPKRYHHGDLRKALIDAALRALDDEPVEALTLRQLAQDVGVSHAAPYHHFADLKALLAAVAARGFDRLREAMASRAAEGAGDPFRGLQAAGTGYVTFAVTRPELFRLMFSGRWAETGHYPELQAAESRAFGLLQHLMQGALAGKGEGRDGSGRPAAVAAWATVHGLAVLLVEGRLDFPPDEGPYEGAERLAHEVTTVLGRGLRSL